MNTPKVDQGQQDQDIFYSIKEVSLKSCSSCKKSLPPDTIPRRLNQLCLGKLKNIQDINYNAPEIMDYLLKYYVHYHSWSQFFINILFGDKDSEDVGVELKGFKHYERVIKDYLINLSDAFEKQSNYKIAFQLNSKKLQYAEERPEDIERFQKEIAEAEERIPKEKQIINFLSNKLCSECEEIEKLEAELRELDYEVMKVQEDLLKQEAILKENTVDKERIREIKPLKEAFNIQIHDNVATINAVSMKVDKKEDCWQDLNQGLGMIVWMSQYFLQRQHIKLENVGLKANGPDSVIRFKDDKGWTGYPMHGPLKTLNEKGQFKKGLSILLSIQKIVAESFFKNFERVKELPYPVKPETIEIDRTRLDIDHDNAEKSTLVFSKFLKNWLFLIEIACETQ